MNWTIIWVSLAFLIYIIYNSISLKLFGVPKSLSDTYYLYQGKKTWMEMLFPIMMMSMVVLLMPAWLELSTLSNLQFLAFLAAGSIMFVGAAPAFKSNDLEKKVHTISAICAAIFALLWVVFVSKLWWIILIWFVIISICAILTKTYKTAYIYWLETVAFMSTFSSIIIYYLI